MSDLDDILKGTDAIDSEATTVDESTEELPSPEVDAEPVVEAMGEEEAVESPSTEDRQEVSVSDLQAEIEQLRRESQGLRSAAVAERRKRQQEQEKPKEDFWEDPDKSIAQLKNELQDEVRKETRSVKLDLSEEYARNKYGDDDFNNKMETFAQLVAEERGNNPNGESDLVRKMNGARNPAEFAYKEADKHQKLAKFGDFDSFEEKIRAEERAKAEAELEKRLEEKLAERQRLPGTLSKTRAAGGTETIQESDDSLDNIMGR